MDFLGDMLIGVFLASVVIAMVSQRLRPRARIVAAVSLLLFVVYLKAGPKPAPQQGAAPATSVTK